MLLPDLELEKFLKFLPPKPYGIQADISRFFQQVVFSKPDGISAAITETMEQIEEDQRIPVIFDIDVSKVSSLQPDANTIPAYFKLLHDLKNEIFFENITEEAIVLWN